MQKTTVYMDEKIYRKLKQIAQTRRRAPAEMVREAVAEFTERHAPRRMPRSIGIGRSRTGDIAERAETLLRGFDKGR